MNLSRAFAYIFEDKEWLNKLVILVMLSLVAAIPLLGLPAFAVMLGYLVILVNNVRNGAPRPLPRWDKFDQYLTLGGNVLVALFVYNLPAMLLAFCLFTALTGLGGGLFGSFSTLLAVCCLVPLLLIYSLISWPIMAVAIIRYGEKRQSHILYRAGAYFEIIRKHSTLTVQWITMTLLLNFGVALLAIIPCVGWLIIMALAMPVHGYLLGQFGLNLSRHTP